MDGWWLVAVVVVSLAVGTGAGFLLGRRDVRRGGEDEAAWRPPATLTAIDALVADSIGWLAGRVLGHRGDGERPLTLAPDGTITLLFSDIAGSTPLNRRLGDERFAELLRTHDRIVRDLVRTHEGVVVKTQGDGFMAAFHAVDHAVPCGLALVERLAEDPDVGEPLDLRIGIHTGPAVTADGDVFGSNVAFAARVAGKARGGEVLVSEAVRDHLADDGDLTATLRRRARLRGIPGRQRLYAVSAA